MFICCLHSLGVAQIRTTADGTWLHLDHTNRGEISPLVEIFLFASLALRICSALYIVIRD